MLSNTHHQLPRFLCGPMLRDLDSTHVTLWWVSPDKVSATLVCKDTQGNTFVTQAASDEELFRVRVGDHCVIHCASFALASALPSDTRIIYDLQTSLDTRDDAAQPSPSLSSLTEHLPALGFGQQDLPSFVIKPNVSSVLHGSCRNPHHYSDDGLLAAHRIVETAFDDLDDFPSALLMTGDQIYADHVAGYSIQAIQQVIQRLGLYQEHFEQTESTTEAEQQSFTHSKQLADIEQHLYLREAILPNTHHCHARFMKKQTNPIFTSVYAHNHLIAFNEVIAMYLLVWSPTLWELIGPIDDMSDRVPEAFTTTYNVERRAVEKFVAGLPKVQQLFAHIPSYMIFDDHDVTDDWNLTALWEKAAYENSLSRQVIGNCLLGYWLCQAIGNTPKQWQQQPALLDTLNTWQREQAAHIATPALTNDIPTYRTDVHNTLISALLARPGWGYQTTHNPPIIVVDSRTQRWRSELNLASPSGLLDWEGLCELQQALIGEKAVILVAPAPIFGVKAIEAVQRIVTWFGFPLMVDAENWMAHRGGASTVLNIFKHTKTPKHFVILSGDVHYSFVYDIVLRFKRSSPRIWQITSSGLKNQFPPFLLRVFEQLNTLLYGRYSPLNFLTKRRHMHIRQRLVESSHKNNRHLLNQSSVGLIHFKHNGAPKQIKNMALIDGQLAEFSFVTKPKSAKHAWFDQWMKRLINLFKR